MKVIEPLFGSNNVDFAELLKESGTPLDKGPERTRSPAECTGIEVKVIPGDPDPARISTSYVDRQNLTKRMGLRRFTRMTNGFSKKVENLAHAVSLHYMHHNFARSHQTLTRQYGLPTIPAMGEGKADHVWSAWAIAELLG